MRIQKVFAGALVPLVLSAMTPLGCGAAQDEYTVISPSSGLSSAPAAKEWEVPEANVETLRGCVKKHARDIKGYRHEAHIKLNLEDDGTVHDVEMQRSTLHLDKLESCLQEALAGLSIPSSALVLRSSEPFSGGESQRKDRAYQGVVQAAAPVVAVAPIIVIAVGVTLAVYLAAAVTEEAIEAVKRRNEVERRCYAYLYRCLGTNPGDCNICFRECKRHGYWDENKCPLSKPN